MVVKGAGAKNLFKKDKTLNNNTAFSKTILISRDPNMLKSLIFVLSYFIRSKTSVHCSASFEKEHGVELTKNDDLVDRRNEKENQCSNVQSLVPLHSLLYGNSGVGGIRTDGKCPLQNESVDSLINSSNEKLLSTNRTSEKKVSFIVGAPLDSSSQPKKRDMKTPENKLLSNNANNSQDKTKHVLMCPLPKLLRLVNCYFTVVHLLAF